MDKELKGFTEHLADAGKEINEMNVNYDSSSEDFRLFFEKEDKARAKAQERVIDLRFKMKKLLTAEQWEAIFGTTSGTKGD
jgi:hypothetical protein